MIETFENANS